MVVEQGEKLFYSHPDMVAVALPPVEQKQQRTGTISDLLSKNEDLKPLTVVFHCTSLNLNPSDIVFLRPESYSANYMSAVFQVSGLKFLLIPKEAVITMLKGDNW